MSSKIRETLEEVVSILSTWTDHLPPVIQEKAQEAIDKAEAALDEPLRNCEVGAAEEQTERFKDLCRKYRRGPGPRANCKGCPIQHESQHVGCTFAWSQMPYESEVK